MKKPGFTRKLRELSLIAGELVSKRRSLLTFLRYCRDTAQASGTVDLEEFEHLIALARKAATHGGPLVEIGTLFGLSTQALALGKELQQTLYTVDQFSWNPIGIPHWRHRQLTMNNLQFLVRSQNVKLIESSNVDFYENWTDRTPSLVFIDAGHTYEAVKVDIAWAASVDAPIICGDDFSYAGVKSAVEEAFGDRYYTEGDMWIHLAQ